jgi:hypothetical protein
MAGLFRIGSKKIIAIRIPNPIVEILLSEYFHG